MTPPDLLDYHRSHACAAQWRGFLRALGEEFEHALPEADLARLMARIGERFAQAQPLPGAASLDALEGAANTMWSTLDWGFVAFEERPDQVLIRHAASPLSAALGVRATWAAGFLEGVYRGWFRAAGMAAGLDVRIADAGSQDLTTFVLSRVS